MRLLELSADDYRRYVATLGNLDDGFRGLAAGRLASRGATTHV